MILAVIQGVTEWLPISSSGHLVIAQEYLGLRLPLFFDVVLHLGSLLVVLTVFWDDVIKILKALVHLDFRSEEGKLGVYTVLGTAATALIGFTFRNVIESLFHNLTAVGVAFILTGSFYGLLYVFRRSRKQSMILSPERAVLIGVAQGVALIPGVSRSGSTIATGLFLGVDKQKAFKFSFLLFIPAVIGATVLTVLDAETPLIRDFDYMSMFLGLAVTVVVGYFSLKLLQRIVLGERLYLFAGYCWIIGSIVVLAQFLSF